MSSIDTMPGAVVRNGWEWTVADNGGDWLCGVLGQVQQPVLGLYPYAGAMRCQVATFDDALIYARRCWRPMQPGEQFCVIHLPTRWCYVWLKDPPQ